MTLSQVLQNLDVLDRLGIYIFSVGDFLKMAPRELASIMVREGILSRPCWGLLCYNKTKSTKDALDRIAIVLRRGHYSFVIREDFDLELGLPVLFLGTTGTTGRYMTTYGIVDFTHTALRIADLVKTTCSRPDRCLRFANANFHQDEEKTYG